MSSYPIEMIWNISTFVDIPSFNNILRTCRGMNEYVKKYCPNHHLWPLMNITSSSSPFCIYMNKPLFQNTYLIHNASSRELFYTIVSITINQKENGEDMDLYLFVSMMMIFFMYYDILGIHVLCTTKILNHIWKIL